MSAGRALVTALAWPRRAVSTAVPLARNRLMRLPKAQLVERVKGLGLQESGTKADLVVRIMGSSGTAAPAPAALGEDEIGALKVSELKARLQALGGKTAGSKSELQTRLRAYLFLAEDEAASSSPPASAPNATAQRPLRAASTARQAAPQGRRERTHAWEGIGAIAGGAASTVDEAARVSIRMSGGQHALAVSVNERQKSAPRRKDTDELGLTRLDREKLLQKRVWSLYRRCLRSAERCPDPNWRESMTIYVRNRFRESGDALPIRLSMGEAELEQMESYHASRELAAAEKRRLVEHLSADDDVRESETEGN